MLLRLQTLYRTTILAPLTALLLLSACSGGNGNGGGSQPAAPEETDPNVIQIAGDEQFQTHLKEALFNAQPGNIIELPDGEFSLNSELTLDVDNVTVRGSYNFV